ncbi:hypothetical protein F4X73_12490, partial [Candidatus Poribacteria bacterium]|nr:hypothetical protein [Candidatus Poribacteria bacterium]
MYRHQSENNYHPFITLFSILAILVPILVISGCVKMEATRKADWETNFTDLHFVNAKMGWLVGLGGVIVHTADGGKTWVQQEVETTSDFKAVYFANEKYGWVVGDEGTIA